MLEIKVGIYIDGHAHARKVQRVRIGIWLLDDEVGTQPLNAQGVAAVQVRIIACFAEKRIVAEATVERVVVGAAVQDIIAKAPEDQIVSGIAEDLIVAVAAIEGVVAIAPVDGRVIAGPEQALADRVISSQPLNIHGGDRGERKRAGKCEGRRSHGAVVDIDIRFQIIRGVDHDCIGRVGAKHVQNAIADAGSGEQETRLQFLDPHWPGYALPPCIAANSVCF